MPFDPATHTFTRDDGSRDGSRVLSVTQILAKAGICDYSAVPQADRDRAMKRGSSVHWLTQLNDEGALKYRSVPRSLRPFLKAYKTWLSRSRFQILMIERPFILEDWNFAGIIDRAGTFPASTMYTEGTKAIVDIKTGTSVQDWVRYQLCAYTLGIEPQPSRAKFIRRIALLLQEDGSYSIKEFPLCTWGIDFATFIKAKDKAYASS